MMRTPLAHKGQGRFLLCQSVVPLSCASQLCRSVVPVICEAYLKQFTAKNEVKSFLEERQKGV